MIGRREIVTPPSDIRILTRYSLHVIFFTTDDNTAVNQPQTCINFGAQRIFIGFVVRVGLSDF